MATHSNSPKGQLSNFADDAMSSTQKEATKGGMFLMGFMAYSTAPQQQLTPQQEVAPQSELAPQSNATSSESFNDQLRCVIDTALGRSW